MAYRPAGQSDRVATSAAITLAEAAAKKPVAAAAAAREYGTSRLGYGRR